MGIPSFEYFLDANGQYWALNVNTDGTMNLVPSAAPTPPAPVTNVLVTTASTIKLINTMEFAKRMNFNKSSAIGNQLEPAATSANMISQAIMGPPFSWRWNRVVTGFITTPGQQDYTILNWQSSFFVPVGWVTVDTVGNCQRCTAPGDTGTVYPTFSGTIGGTTADGSAVWTNLGPIGVTTSSNYRFGWMETIAVQDVSLDPPKWYEIESKLVLGLDSAPGRPRNIAAQGDDGNGNITFRLMLVPDEAYPVAITLQQKPLLFKSTQQTWAPIPDDYSHIFDWGFLSLMWLFGDDARFQTANQKFVTALLSASEGLTETEKNIFLNSWSAITGEPILNQNRMSQGQQARGV